MHSRSVVFIALGWFGLFNLWFGLFNLNGSIKEGHKYLFLLNFGSLSESTKTSHADAYVKQLSCMCFKTFLAA